MSRTINLAVIPGDGIGSEVVGEGLKVLDVVAAKYGVTFNKTHYDLGAGYWHRTGEVLPDSVLKELAKSDVILLGAVGDPTVPSGVLERGLLLKLRFAFDHYINLRPAKLMPGVTGPLATKAPIDFVVVREGTEGPYVGAGGVLAEGTDAEIATEESLNTRRGAERVIRDAFARAAARDRKKLTLVHKNNVLTRARDGRCSSLQHDQRCPSPLLDRALQIVLLYQVRAEVCGFPPGDWCELVHLAPRGAHQVIKLQVR